MHVENIHVYMCKHFYKGVSCLISLNGPVYDILQIRSHLKCSSLCFAAAADSWCFTGQQEVNVSLGFSTHDLLNYESKIKDVTFHYLWWKTQAFELLICHLQILSF